jgi:hypothetical protein
MAINQQGESATRGNERSRNLSVASRNYVIDDEDASFAGYDTETLQAGRKATQELFRNSPAGVTGGSFFSTIRV